MHCLAVGLAALAYSAALSLGTYTQGLRVPQGVLEAATTAAHRSRLPLVHTAPPNPTPEVAKPHTLSGNPHARGGTTPHPRWQNPTP